MRCFSPNKTLPEDLGDAPEKQLSLKLSIWHETVETLETLDFSPMCPGVIDA